ncbi:MAG: carbohydrate kinase family protein [Thainema sp.]
MTSPRVLCLGEVLFDLLADQAGQPLESVSSWTAYPGGAPANVACALVKLGTPAAFIGCVGQDAPGETLVNLLNEIGVNTQGVQRHATAPTREIYVVRSQTGDREFAGFKQYDTTAFADTRLQADQLDVQLFDEADFLVLGTLELAYPDTRAAIAAALDLAEQRYLKVALDVNWRPVFWPDPDAALPLIRDILPRIDFLKLSEEEGEWLFGTTDPGAIARQLEDIEAVFVTQGAKGCAYYISGNEGRAPALPVEVEDTTGAGDGFLAGVVHQLATHGLVKIDHPDHARQIVTYGNAVGGLTTTRLGAIAAQPIRSEVEAFLFLLKQEQQEK